MSHIFTSKFTVELSEEPVTSFLFANLKEEHLNKVAFIDAPSGATYTYGAINSSQRNVAAGLYNDFGIKKGDVVGILLHNCVEFPISFYALASLGAVITTLNPLYTAHEIENQLKDSKATSIITASPYLEKVLEAKSHIPEFKHVVLIDKAESDKEKGLYSFPELMKKEGVPPKVEINAKEDTLVVPYSSGTTGVPKGVVLTHYNIVSNVLQIVIDNMSERDVFIAFLPFFHIYGLSVLLNAAVYLRGSLVIMPRFDLPQFLDCIQKYKVSVAHIVPPVALALAKHPIVDKYDLKSVRKMVSGAAPLGSEIQSILAARLGCIVKQGYGMTELSPVSHLCEDHQAIAGSIGPLAANCIAKIVDVDTNESVGPNKQGEICVKGPNVMKGYLNRPDATAQTIDSDGYLHTGDIGYVDDNGLFFIVDRLKELIKYKGFQVAPAELEAQLIAHPDVADVAVVPVPDEEAGELPKAYIVLKPERTVAHADLHSFLESKIAPHKKLRGGIEFTDNIPKSPSGKILRRILVQKEREKYNAAKKQ